MVKKEDCIEALKEVSGDEDTLTVNEYKERRHPIHPSVSSIIRRFGDWNSAIYEAGLRARMKKNYSEQEIKDAIEDVRKQIGRPPTKKEYEDLRELFQPSIEYIQSNVGWLNIIEQLDYNTYNNFLEEEIISCISDVAEELGKSPTCTEYEETKPDDYPSYRTICNRIGWNEAKKRADIKRYNDGSAVSYPYGSGWESIRQEIIQRDGYECVSCGVNDEKHYDEYGFSLHVHHLIKIRSFFDDFTTDELEELNDGNPSDELVQRAEKRATRANHEANLVTVCIDCHDELEGKKLERQLDILKS